MIKIYHPNNIKDIKIKIKKPFCYGNTIIFELLNEKNEKIFIQTPTMILPFNYIYNGNNITNNYVLTLCEYNNTYFTNLIDNLLKKIIESVKNKYKKLFNNKIIENIFYELPTYPKMFRFNNIKINDIEIYNILREKITLLDLSKDDLMTCIFSISKIYIYEDKCNIKFDLIQLRKDNNIIKNYIFLDSNEQQDKFSRQIEENKCSFKSSSSITYETKKNISTKIGINLNELLEKRKKILNK